MASRTFLVVFVLPAVFSVALGSAVMGAVLDPGWRSAGLVEIYGLALEYPAPGPVIIEVLVRGGQGGCGDLTVSIHPAGGGDPAAVEEYPGQCPGAGGVLLAGGEFSAQVPDPGSYVITAELALPGAGTASVSEEFTVK